MTLLEELKQKLLAAKQALEQAQAILNRDAPQPVSEPEPQSLPEPRRLNRFPCKKGCGREIVMSYTAKNNVSIVLEEVEDEDNGCYYINERGKAVYTGDAGGPFAFHFKTDKTCKSIEEIEGLI
jgi:hypothetical protein